MIRERNFLARLLNTSCFGDPGMGGDGAGGGGPAPSAPTGGEPSSGTPSSAPSEPTRVGGGTDQPYNHQFPQPKVDPDQAVRVRGILDMEKDPNHSLTMENINDLLGFNPPFQPPAQPQDQTPPANQVVPPPAPAAPAQPQEPQLTAGEKAIIDAIKGQLQQQPAQPAQPQPAQPTQPQQPKLYYGQYKPAMQVPEQVAAALFNAENPQQSVQALNYLVNGIMNQVMQDVAQDNVQMVRAILTRIPEMAQSQYRASSSFDRFYNEFPELQKEALKPVVKAISEALANQRARSGQPVWDQSFNQTLGEAVHAYIEQQLGVKLIRGNNSAAPVLANAPPKPQAPAAPAAPAPASNGSHGQPWMTPGGSRPPAGPGAKDQSAAMFDLIL